MNGQYGGWDLRGRHQMTARTAVTSMINISGLSDYLIQINDTGVSPDRVEEINLIWMVTAKKTKA